MTYQVGIVASDGIVLASDMLQLSTYAGFKPPETDLVRKIVTVPDKALAYCCAGDELSMVVGKEIERAMDPSNHQDRRAFFCECAQRAIENLSDRHKNLLTDGTLLIVCGDPRPELWKFPVLRVNDKTHMTPDIIPSLGYAIAGDVSSYARFFLDQYLDRDTRPKPSAKQLTLLAAHVVISAGRLNPRQVRGVEMVICANGKLERLTSIQIEKLENASVELHRYIRGRLRDSSDLISGL